MFAGQDQTIVELVREGRLVGEAALEAARTAAGESGRDLAETLMAMNVVDRSALLRAIADHLSADWIDPLPATLDAETLALLDGNIARAFGVMPLRSTDDGLELLATDPFRPELANDLVFLLGRRVKLIVGDPAIVSALWQHHYGSNEPPRIDPVEEAPANAAPQPESNLSEADIEQMAGQTPVIRFVNLVLGQAIRDRASDIHFEPFEDGFKIRYRIDGALHEMAPPSKVLALPIISRVKVLANLNIAERRRPQDGRIRLQVAGRPVDLRVSTLPTQFGESVVLRVLDQSTNRLDLGQLGMPPEIETGMRNIIGRPNGIVLVTGPTGSGKTTTLYSCLKELNSTDSKLLTVEDPVEYEIDGVMQVPINPAADLGFARAVRAFLRQDPDIVMVGEIRDLETARIAIQAALTGHLVLSTLHTNDAPGAVSRLVDMGVEPFLLASTLEGVLAQRLVRCVCPDCCATQRASAEVQTQLGVATEMAEREFPVATGCAACRYSGYSGRAGIYEFLRMNDALRELIVAKAPLDALQAEARRAGLVPLREAGLALAIAGKTTLEELGRHI